jgi:phosphatidylglycerol lysyltransferase
MAGATFERLSTLLRRVAPLLGVAFFALALWALHDWLGGERYRALRQALAALPAAVLVQAAIIAAAASLAPIGYDLIALRVVGQRVAGRTVAVTGFVANALGNNFGNMMLTGAAVRYWAYAAAGLSAAQITSVVVACSAAFWLAFLAVGGTVFVLEPMVLPAAVHALGTTTRVLGVVMLVLVAGALWLSARRRPLVFGARRLMLPSPALMLGLIAVGTLDLGLMSAVFHALLPAGAGVGYVHSVGVVLFALLAGNLSLVPGGLGVFETVVALLLGSRVPAADLAAALVVFRGLYFLAPLLVALVLLGLREVAGLLPAWRGRFPQGAHALLGLTPQVMAGAAFVSGALLLFSGAVPAAAGRLEAVHRLLALPVIEASHFLASLAGAALLLLAHGLQRRLDAAWHLAVMLLAVGALLSLSKGWDFEEAALLGLAGAVVLPSRRLFYRRSSLLAEPFGAPWAAATAIVIAASVWLVWFGNRHEWAAGLAWWDFALHAEASRSLRATAGAAALAALFALYRLLRPWRPSLPKPAPADLERARAIVERSTSTYARLALRGDKTLMFSAAGDAFLMYGRKGRSWIAMGDPVGSEDGARELRWRFRDLCDRFDGWCVFFEVPAQRRADYAELGLALTPLGERARIDLAAFDIEARAHRDLRQARAKLRRAGWEFALVAPDAVSGVIDALARISTEWLKGKAAREKGFSNASFDPSYLAKFPVAVVRRAGEVVAFANLWLGAGKEEFSVDLMRHLPSAPNGTMDFLFGELLLWGKAQGWRWFDFGMAPLAGLDKMTEAPVWRRLGTLLYRHGEHFYNFEGLRRYKAKFDPVWTPMYLASPGGVALPVILADVAALIAGGWIGIVSGRGDAAAS